MKSSKKFGLAAMSTILVTTFFPSVEGLYGYYRVIATVGLVIGALVLAVAFLAVVKEDKQASAPQHPPR